MVDKSKLAIATSQIKNRIIFKLNYYSTYCLKWLLYLPLSLQVNPWDSQHLKKTGLLSVVALPHNNGKLGIIQEYVLWQVEK